MKLLTYMFSLLALWALSTENKFIPWKKKKCFHDNLPQQAESKRTSVYITYLFLVPFVAVIFFWALMAHHEQEELCWDKCWKCQACSPAAQYSSKAFTEREAWSGWHQLSDQFLWVPSPVRPHYLLTLFPEVVLPFMRRRFDYASIPNRFGSALPYQLKNEHTLP